MSAVSVNVDGQHRQTLRQQWTARLNRDLSPYLHLGARARYQRFDLDELDVPGTFRAQWQPAFELDWRHPRFNLRTAYSHREEELSAADGLLLSDTREISLRTRNQTGPILRANYSVVDREDHRSFDQRESRDRTARVSAEWSNSNLSGRYTYSDRDTRNLIRDLSSRQRDHRLQSEGMWTFPRMMSSTLAVDATMYVAQQEDEVLNGNVLLEAVQVSEGLYARDLTPTSDALETSPQLVDGDRASAVIPRIDIGGSSTDQNLGADLGFARAVSAAEVSTDRISGDDVAWDLYASEDGFLWEDAGTVNTFFNPSLLRYELSFAAVNTRYIKVVNRNGNAVPEVFVTEIEFFEGREGVGRQERQLTGGRATARWAQHATESLDTSLQASFQSDPGTSQVGRNRQLVLATQAVYSMSPELRHSLRWSGTTRTFAGERQNFREDHAAYTLTWEPSRQAVIRTTADSRFTQVEGSRSLEIYTLSSQARVDLLPSLSVGLAPALSRREDFIADELSDQWSMTMNLEATPYPRLITSSTWRHQETIASRRGVNDLARDALDLSGQLRITPSLQLRSRWVWIQDAQRSSRQDHLLSWQLGRQLRLAATSTIEDSSGDRHSFRYTTSMNFDLGTRTTLYLRYSMNDLRRSDGNRTESFEQGFRTTF